METPAGSWSFSLISIDCSGLLSLSHPNPLTSEWHMVFSSTLSQSQALIFKGQPCQEFQFYGRLDIRQNSPRPPFAKSSALIGFPINSRFMLHNCWTILHASTVMNKLLQKHSLLMTSRKHNQLSHVLCNELVLFHRKLKEISLSIFDGSMRRKMLQRKWNKSQKRRCSDLWNTSGRLDAITFSVKDDSLQRNKISHVLFFFLYFLAWIVWYRVDRQKYF